VFGRALLVLVGVLAIPGLGRAQQTDYSAGKSPAQLFAGDCSTCHKSPRGLAKGQDSRSLSDFLREHYTTRPENASALAAYLLGNPGPAVEPRQQAESPRGRKPRAATANAPAPAPAAEPERSKPAEELNPFERLFGRESEPEKSTPVIAAPEEGAKPATEPGPRARPAHPARPDRKQKRKPVEATAHPHGGPETGRPDEKPAEVGKEPGKSEANKEDATKAGTAETGRAERLKAEAAKAKTDAAKAEAAREAAKEAASKAETAREAAAKAEAAKADAAKAEAAKAEAAKLRSYATGGEEAKPAQADAPAAPPGGSEPK
jgi:hypothetical protein